jgi:hypothetical protein
MLADHEARGRADMNGGMWCGVVCSCLSQDIGDPLRLEGSILANHDEISTCVGSDRQNSLSRSWKRMKIVTMGDEHRWMSSFYQFP